MIPSSPSTLSGLGKNAMKVVKIFSKEKKADAYINLNPLVHGRFFRPITQIENGIKRFFYIHRAYPQFFCLILVLRVLGLKNASKFDIFQKFQKPKSSFLNIFQKFLQK